MAANLPIDIITEILSRLPVESLVRFLSVNKSWYSLIKSPNFINIHLNQTLTSTSYSHVLLTSGSIYTSKIEFNHNHLHFSELVNHPLQPHNVEFIGSYNGIVCICDRSRNDVFLYNPLTGSHRKLPSLCVLPPLEWVAFGFGYDSKNDDYKVLRVHLSTLSINEHRVYNLKSNSWKLVQGIPYPDLLEDHPGAFVNDATHFLCLADGLDLKRNSIIRFDFRTETCSDFEFPKYDDSPDDWLALSELGGYLCMVVNSYVYRIDGKSFGADLWVMKEYGKQDSWMRLFRIRKPLRIGVYGKVNVVYSNKDLTKILLNVECLNKGRVSRELGWCDVRTKRFEKLSWNTSSLPKQVFVLFVGSLVSLV